MKKERKNIADEYNEISFQRVSILAFQQKMCLFLYNHWSGMIFSYKPKVAARSMYRNEFEWKRKKKNFRNCKKWESFSNPMIARLLNLWCESLGSDNITEFLDGTKNSTPHCDLCCDSIFRACVWVCVCVSQVRVCARVFESLRIYTFFLPCLHFVCDPNNNSNNINFIIITIIISMMYFVNNMNNLKLRMFTTLYTTHDRIVQRNEKDKLHSSEIVFSRKTTANLLVVLNFSDSIVEPTHSSLLIGQLSAQVFGDVSYLLLIISLALENATNAIETRRVSESLLTLKNRLSRLWRRSARVLSRNESRWCAFPHKFTGTHTDIHTYGNTRDLHVFFVDFLIIHFLVWLVRCCFFIKSALRSWKRGTIRNFLWFSFLLVESWCWNLGGTMNKGKNKRNYHRVPEQLCCSA